MDIDFSCDKCGQSLIIDEAGAGLTVQCPACGVELTVPKPELPSPPPIAETTSRQLYDKARDLAYELRVEDAIRVLRQADEARARERGYPARGTFKDHGLAKGVSTGVEVTISIGDSPRHTTVSAQSVVEPARWVIKHSLQNLTPEEEREIFGAILCIKLFNAGMDEILAVTLGSNLSWPALDDSFLRFKEAKHWPSTWKVYPASGDEPAPEFYGKNLGQTTDPMLAAIHGLSLNARRLLLRGWLGWTEPERAKLNGADYDKVIEELVSAGFAVRGSDLPIAERLCLLPMSEARKIQRAHGVKGAKSKEQIVHNLLTSVAPEALDAALCFDTYVKLNVGYRKLNRYWFEYARAELLATTFFWMMFHYDRFKQFQNAKRMDGGWPYRIRTYMSEQSPKCPICRSAAKRFDKMSEATLDAIPPFHPGCTCGMDECEE
jgi:hypothetical protein